jgi:diguanylate cyclase (GGDEF)-like protein
MMELPEKLQKALSNCSTLPSAPGAVFEILELCRDSDISITKVAKILSRDPALSAKTLTVANSPLFGVRSEVTTVDRAVALLGINATLSFALSFVLVRSLRKLQKDTFDHSAFWRRSAIAAVTARTMGSYTSKTPSDELFIAGLLQDIGMLALNESVPNLYRHLTVSGKWEHSAVMETERQAVGADHAAVSAWLLHRWNLPEKYWRAAAGSHEPETAEGPEKDLVQTAALASSIAEIWMHQQNAAAAAEAARMSVRLFKIPTKTFEAKLREIAIALPEATRNLDIDLGGEEKIFQLFDQARETLVSLTLQIQQQARELASLSHKDALTSLYNRAHLDETLPTFFDKSVASGQPLSVIFLDLDHFKRVNDTYGHHAGDQVLTAVAHWIQGALRGDDIVARYGGEEFVCLLPDTDEAGASFVAERLRASISGRSIATDDGNIVSVTISAGCATRSARRQFGDMHELLKSADQCLYAAKGAGRNRVVTLDSITRN